MEIRLPLRYREVGSEQWLESETSNISRTGVLFRCDKEFQAGELVQIDLRLPAVKPVAEERAQFASVGRVARCIASSGLGVELAVQFLQYEFTKGKQTGS